MFVEKVDYLFVDESFKDFTETVKKTYRSIVIHKYLFHLFVKRYDFSPFKIISKTGRGTSAETCGLDDVFPPDDLGSRPEALC